MLVSSKTKGKRKRDYPKRKLELGEWGYLEELFYIHGAVDAYTKVLEGFFHICFNIFCYEL